MNTEYPAAFRACPSLLFAPNEMPDTEFLYGLEIIDHAHAVFGPVALIKMLEPGAGKVITTSAVLGFSVDYLHTRLYFARDTVLRFQVVVASAAGA
jgi:hypothetical protein